MAPTAAAPLWFAFDASRLLACFACPWRCWDSVRKVKEGEVTADLFGFFTISSG
jgi:hypothetical protein